MQTADLFLSELELKNQDSFRNLISSHYLPALSGEAIRTADALRWEAKMVIESIEVDALWLADTESLEMKLAFAGHCGDRARHFNLLSERLSVLGLAPGSYDPRHGGYSRLFAFLRSLQTPEERVAAGFFTLGAMSVARLEALAAWCREKGDPETSQLLAYELLPNESSRVDFARDSLATSAIADDVQSRIRRASYRTVELLTDLHDEPNMRKLLGRAPQRR